VVRNVLAASLALGLIVLALAAEAPAKESRPFRGSGEAVWDNIFNALTATANFRGIAQVTHLGRVQQQGTLVLEAPNANGLFPGHGSVTLTAANGDSLTFDYEGLLNPVTGEGNGTLTFTGGTGRFADATGNATFRARINLGLPANQPMTVELSGRLAY
jgi:hypothetical protein